LDLLKSMAPNIVRVAYLFNPNTTPAFYSPSIEATAPTLSLKAVAAAVQNSTEIEPVMEAFAREPNGGVLVMPDIFTSVNRQLIMAVTSRLRLPTIYGFRYSAWEGGLMSYGIDVLHVYRQAASYVDRVLRGANPGDLPVQAPTKFEFVINLKTAKALGLDVPSTLLARADEVIE
jgi:putative ABC transport system substrate-binding protein